MNTLIAFIIFLSFYGVYINLYGSKKNLADPELYNRSMSSKDFLKVDESLTEEVKDILKKEGLNENIVSGVDTSDLKELNDILKDTETSVEEIKYNEIGEDINSSLSGKRIVNGGRNSKGGSGTRAYGWTRPSSSYINENGLKDVNISYKDNFPYADSDMKIKSSESKISNEYSKLIKTEGKGETQRGVMILPKDESLFNEGKIYMDRAKNIYKNRISNESKNTPDINNVDVDLLYTRNGYNLNSIDELSGSIEIKSRPDAVDFRNNIEHINFQEKLKPFNKMNAEMNMVTKNFNIK